MEALSMGEIARAANGVLMNFEEESEVSGVSTDSRKINPGDMFIALAGENFDGHDFIDKAIEKGAVLAVTQRLPKRCKISASASRSSQGRQRRASTPRLLRAAAVATFRLSTPDLIGILTICLQAFEISVVRPRDSEPRTSRQSAA